MIPSHLVPTVEQCRELQKALKSVGVELETAFYWSNTFSCADEMGFNRWSIEDKLHLVDYKINRACFVDDSDKEERERRGWCESGPWGNFEGVDIDGRIIPLKFDDVKDKIIHIPAPTTDELLKVLPSELFTNEDLEDKNGIAILIEILGSKKFNLSIRHDSCLPTWYCVCGGKGNDSLEVSGNSIIQNLTQVTIEIINQGNWPNGREL